MAREFTRQAFYELVWSKPIVQIAKDFALSDVAIHKICRKHDIPTPPVGWWAKKQAGKLVKQTPLAKPAKGAVDRIVIAAPELRKEASPIATIREEARVKVSALPADADIPRHPLVAQTITALRKTASTEKGVIAVAGPGLIRCEIGPASIDRLQKVLARIVVAAEMQGFQLGENGASVHFAGDGETISIAVTEVVKRVQHVLTPKEQKELDAWEKKRERDNRRRTRDWDSEWDFELRPRFQDWDYICTGQLGFEMEGVYVGGHNNPRSTFRDAKIQRLENLAEDISVALVVLAVTKREERERRAEAERVRIEERRIRERPLRDKFIAERRREGLEKVLADLANLERLRGLLRGIDSVSTSEQAPRVVTFLAWAREEMAAREAAFGAEGLEQRFEAARLFGVDDDHDFKSPIWF